VLLCCFAGCERTAILAKMGLSWRNLFAGPPPSAVQFAALQIERGNRERDAREQRRTLREAWDCVRKWQAVVDALGDRLAHTPDAEARELARLFSEACNRMHEAETEAEAKENEARAKGKQAR
jgi:hypothetical protein